MTDHLLKAAVWMLTEHEIDSRIMFNSGTQERLAALLDDVSREWRERAEELLDALDYEKGRRE